MVGSDSGIGAAIIRRCLAGGHGLSMATRDPQRVEAQPGMVVDRYEAADPSAKLSVPDGLDGLIYLPGTITLKPFHRLTHDDLTHDMEVNFFGAVRALQQALPSLKKSSGESASVVLFSSVAATVGMPFHASIGAAKAAIEGLTRSLAAELSPKIRVNTIAPSLTDTPLASQFLSDGERRGAAAKRHPLRRIGQPSEIAELVTFLLGDGALSISGQILHADGGMSTLRKF